VQDFPVPARKPGQVRQPASSSNALMVLVYIGAAQSKVSTPISVHLC
jgi:hypothetical protein